MNPNTQESALRKIPQFHLISWWGNFVERQSFRIVLGDSLKEMRKLCLSAKLLHQEIRWNYGILRSFNEFDSQKVESFKYNISNKSNNIFHCIKNDFFPSRISSVNVTKSVENCRFGHIYWRNP